MTPTLRSIAPSFPKPGTSLPVFASSAISWPSLVPAKIRGVVFVAWPVGDAARRRASPAQLVLPDFPSGVGLEREDAAGRDRRVQDAADDDWHRLGRGQQRRRGIDVGSRRIDPVLPGQLEPRDVLRVDLRQRRIALARGIMAVGRPVRLGVQHRHDTHQHEQPEHSHHDLRSGSSERDSVLPLVQHHGIDAGDSLQALQILELSVLGAIADDLLGLRRRIASAASISAAGALFTLTRPR